MLHVTCVTSHPFSIIFIEVMYYHSDTIAGVSEMVSSFTSAVGWLDLRAWNSAWKLSIGTNSQPAEQRYCIKFRVEDGH